MITQFYKLLVDIAGRLDKPISKATVDDFAHALREFEAKQKPSASTSS